MSEKRLSGYCEHNWTDFVNPCPECKEASELAAPPCSPSGIELEVCNDIAARQAKGLAKYGATVANNPLELKAWLQHAYEETLDKAIYLKAAIRKMENK